MRKLLSLLLLLTLLFTILLIAVQPAFAAGGQTPSGIPFSELEKQIDALMDEHVGTSTPGAAIVVVNEGEIILSRGYGWADIENRIPVDPATTVFEYGSISKTFIWVAVMQLVEQGLLDLDADAGAYLPDSFIFEEPFTTRDLLNHAAGFADYLLGLFVSESRVEQCGSLEETLLDLQPPQIFTPGTVSAYSNWGAALAAFIVQQISGQAYCAFERENILLPANMSNTLNQPDWLGNHDFLQNKAKGYNPNAQGGFQESGWAHIPLYPPGAMNGTAEDLAAYIIALTPPEGEPGPLFADKDTLSALFSPSSQDPIGYPGTHHGFIQYPGVLPAVGHSGGTVAFLTDYAIVPQARFGYVVFTNAAGHMDFTPAVCELLLGSPQTPIAGSDMPNAAAVEGLYITARRYKGDFTEFFTYAGLAGIPIIEIKALDENRIQLNFGSYGTAVYVQTEPYIFQFYDSPDLPFLAAGLFRLSFRIEDGTPTQIHVGDGADFTALPAGRTMPFLIASLVIVLLSVVYFIILPIVLPVIFLIGRKKQSPRTLFDRFTTCFFLSGTLLALNNLLLFGRFGVNPYREIAEVAPHIWINYALTGLVIFLFTGSLWSWRTSGEARGKRKVLFVITAVISVLFITILYNWNFYVIL